MSVSLPTYDQPLVINEQTSSVWYRFFQALFQGQASAIESQVTVTASPFVYKAPSGGALLIDGGTVTALQLTRSAYYTLGVNAGLLPLAYGDEITVTYTVAPTMTFFPS